MVGLCLFVAFVDNADADTVTVASADSTAAAVVVDVVVLDPLMACLPVTIVLLSLPLFVVFWSEGHRPYVSEFYNPDQPTLVLLLLCPLLVVKSSSSSFEMIRMMNYLHSMMHIPRPEFFHWLFQSSFVSLFVGQLVS